RMVRTLPVLPIPGGDLHVFVTTIGDVLAAIVAADRAMTGEVLNLFVPEPITLGGLMARTRAAVNALSALLSIPAAIAGPLLACGAPFHSGVRAYRENLAALAASQDYRYTSSYPRLGLRVRSIDMLLAEALAA